MPKSNFPQAGLMPLYIPDAEPVPINDPNSPLSAVGNSAINAGLKVFIEPYSEMAISDHIDIIWDQNELPFASMDVTEENLNQTIGFNLPQERFNDGDFAPFYRLTRISGFREESPRLEVRVKTIVPGGFDPNPETPVHENLVVPLVPSDVEDEGISAERAKQGVEVTIRPWRDMAEYDRLDFSWGGVRILHIVQPAEVDTNIVILVSQAQILEAGDGEIPLQYHIIDAADNPSEGWSLKKIVNVFASDAVLNAPTVVQADADGVLDIDLLNGADVRVTLFSSDRYAAVGDTIILSWQGRDATGTVVNFSDTHTLITPPPNLETFDVPYAIAAAATGGQAVVSYVLHTSNNTYVSKRTLVQVTGSVQLLHAPIVSEAVDDTLDGSLAQATVVIAPWQGMAAGDLVTMRWDGERANGEAYTYSDQRTISGSSVGKNVTFTVPEEHISALAGGKLDVFWRLDSVGARSLNGTHASRESEHLYLHVSQAQTQLPTPTVAPLQNGAIDPTQPSVTATVPASANTQVGDVVYLWWSQDGSPHSDIDFIPISGSLAGKALPFTVENSNYSGASKVNLYYSISRGSTVLTSTALPLNVDNEQATLPVPSVAPLTDGVIDPSQPTVTVTIPASAGTIAGDVVYLWWSQDGATHSDIDFLPVSSGSAGNALNFTVDSSNYADAAEVDLFYTLLRGTLTLTSVALTLNVGASKPTLPAPTVAPLSNGAIDPGQPLVTTTIPASAETLAGDVVHLWWSTDGAAFYELDNIPVTSETAGKALNFTVESDAYAQAQQVAIYYTLSRGDKSLISFTTELNVGTGQIPLPAPTVPEAVDGVLDGSLTSASIVVTGLSAGEAVTGIFGTSTLGPVNANGQGVATIPVTTAAIAAEIGKSIEVRYIVIRNGAPISSNSLALQVSQSGAPNLTAPTAPEATGDNGHLLKQTDYYRLDSLTIRVPQYDGMKAGDTLLVRWKGRVYTWYSNVQTVQTPGVMTFSVPRVEFIDTIAHTAEIQYSVKRGGVGDAYWSPVLSLMVEGQSLHLNPPDISTNHRVVTAWYNGMTTSNLIGVRWRGVVERETQDVRGNTSGRLDFTVPEEWVTENKGKEVLINYHVAPSGGENYQFSRVIRVVM